MNGISCEVAGGSLEHSRLAKRIGTLLTNALPDKRCVALQSDMLVRAPDEGLAGFPDARVGVVAASIEG